MLVCCTVYFSVLAIVDWRKTGTHDLLDARQRRLCNILVSSRSDHFSSLRCCATESIVTLINDLCRRSAVGNSAALSASAFSHVPAAVPQVERRTRCVKGHDIVQEGLRFTTTTIWIVFLKNNNKRKHEQFPPNSGERRTCFSQIDHFLNHFFLPSKSSGQLSRNV